MTTPTNNADLSLRQEFIDESMDGLQSVAGLFVRLESEPSNLDIVQSIFRPIHSLKGNATYFGLMQVKALAHAMENLLDLIRKGSLVPHPHVVSILLKGTDELTAMLNRVRAEQPEMINRASFEQLVMDVNAASKVDYAAKIIQASQAISAEERAPEKSSDKTMRVAESKIDAFLAHVGELLTIGEMYNHLHASITTKGGDPNLASQLRRVNDSFAELSQSLQESIMNIRKVSIQPSLQKLPRIIRDIAMNSKKQIETIVKGGEITVDKSLADILEAPLVHIVRNAADHGIETPEVRTANGKPAQGTIEITASETPDLLLLEITDDGKGLDFAKLKQKAISIGLIQAEQNLSEADIVNLIFQSGVSTAKEVTEVSGRGVGMDVVKRAIEGNGGSIKVSSQPGKGSVFTISLPKSVSTQIFHGFIVGVAGNRYVFPLNQIIRSFRSQKSAVYEVVGKGLCVQDGGHHFHLLPLHSLFGVRAPDFDTGMFVIIQHQEQSYAIHVDQIDGIQQVVLKKINGIHTDGTLCEGGAIMGDGNVAMVIDFDQIRQLKTDLV